MDGTLPGCDRWFVGCLLAIVVGQIAHIVLVNVALLPLWYATFPGARSNRLVGPGPQWPNESMPWNAYTWDVQS